MNTHGSTCLLSGLRSSWGQGHLLLNSPGHGVEINTKASHGWLVSATCGFISSWSTFLDGSWNPPSLYPFCSDLPSISVSVSLWYKITWVWVFVDFICLPRSLTLWLIHCAARVLWEGQDPDQLCVFQWSSLWGQHGGELLWPVPQG